MNCSGMFLRLLLLTCAGLAIVTAASFVLGVVSPIGTFRTLENGIAQEKRAGKSQEIKELTRINTDRARSVKVSDEAPAQTSPDTDATFVIGVNTAGTVKVNNFA
jgi:hypothetical protein